MSQLAVGQVYEWHGIRIEVTEVDPAGSWAMIHCTTHRTSWDGLEWDQEWDKQQSTPGGVFPADWAEVGAAGR